MGITPAQIEAATRSLRAISGALETKTRHVRDSAFWNAPVGTPLPLPPKSDSLLNSPAVLALPPALGTAPLPDGYVRMYHQTSVENLESIKKNGLLWDKGRGIEGPKGVWISDTPFYGTNRDGTITVEVAIPKADRERMGHIASIGDIPPERILTINETWHDRVRLYLGDENYMKTIRSDELDDELADIDLNAPVTDAYTSQLYAVKFIRDRVLKTQDHVPETKGVLHHIRTRAGKLRFHGEIGEAIEPVDLGFVSPKRRVRISNLIHNPDRSLEFGKPVSQERLDELLARPLSKMPKMHEWPPPITAQRDGLNTFADYGDVEIIFRTGFGGDMYPRGMRRNGVVVAPKDHEATDLRFLRWTRQTELQQAFAKSMHGVEYKDKVRHVKDPAYWGLPYNAVIPPGYKPSGPKSPIGKAKLLAGKKTKPKKKVNIAALKKKPVQKPAKFKVYHDVVVTGSGTPKHGVIQKVVTSNGKVSYEIMFLGGHSEVVDEEFVHPLHSPTPGIKKPAQKPATAKMTTGENVKPGKFAIGEWITFDQDFGTTKVTHIGQVQGHDPAKNLYNVITTDGTVLSVAGAKANPYTGPKKTLKATSYNKKPPYKKSAYGAWQAKKHALALKDQKQAERLKDPTEAVSALKSWSIDKLAPASVKKREDLKRKMLDDASFCIIFPEDGSAPYEASQSGAYGGSATVIPLDRTMSNKTTNGVTVPLGNIVPVKRPASTGDEVIIRPYQGKQKPWVGEVLEVGRSDYETFYYVRNPDTGELEQFSEDAITPLKPLTPKKSSDPHESSSKGGGVGINGKFGLHEDVLVLTDDPNSPTGGQWYGYIVGGDKSTITVMPMFGDATPVVVPNKDAMPPYFYERDAWKKKQIALHKNPLTPTEVAALNKKKADAEKANKVAVAARKKASAKYKVGGKVTYSHANINAKGSNNGVIASIDAEGFLVLSSKTKVDPAQVTAYITPELVAAQKKKAAADRAKLLALKNKPITTGMRVRVTPGYKVGVAKHYVTHTGESMPAWEGWAVEETALGWYVLDDHNEVIPVHREQMQVALHQTKVPDIPAAKSKHRNGNPKDQGITPRIRSEYKIDAKSHKVPDIDAYLSRQDAGTLHGDAPSEEPKPVSEPLRPPASYPLKASDPVAVEIDRAREGYEEEELKSFAMFSVARHIIADMQTHGELVYWVQEHMKKQKEKDKSNENWKRRHFLDNVVTGPTGWKHKNKPANTDPRGRLTSLGISEAGANKIVHANSNYNVYATLSDSDKAAVDRGILITDVFHIEDYSQSFATYDQYTAEDLEILHLVDEHIGQWAQSSWDHDQDSIAVQLAAWSVFGLDNQVDRKGGHSNAELKARLDYEWDWPFLEAFVRAEYQNTQDFLATNGVEEVTLFRGMGSEEDGSGIPDWVTKSIDQDVLGEKLAVARQNYIDETLKDHVADDKRIGLASSAELTAMRIKDAGAEWDKYQKDYDTEEIVRELTKSGIHYVDSQPLSSWSTNRPTAKSFGMVLLTATVPAVRIWATSLTGSGCSGEYEFIVIGGNGDPVNLEMK